MRDRDDAFGHALLDRFRGAAACSVVERDDGYVEVDTLDQYFAQPRAWHESERKALCLARGRVLDVGVGAGRVALHLQARGLRVTAIDNSPLAVRVCRGRGVRDARVVPIARAGDTGGGFDTVVMFGNNLGLLGGWRRGRRYLRMFHRLTTDGGRIIAQTLDPRATDNPRHLAYQRRNLRRGRMAGQIRIRCRYREWCNPWFDYLFVSRDELAELARGTGWRVARTLDTDGPVYVAVLEKDGA